MVGNISEEEILLRKRARRRLIGAITLVILSVVFLPMILDDEPRQEQQEIDILIPSEDMTDDAYPWLAPEDALLDGETVIAPDPGKLLPFSDSEYPEETTDIQPDYSSIKGVPVPARKPLVTAQPSVLEKAATRNSGNSINNRDNSNRVGDDVKAPEGTFVIQLGAFSDVSKARQQQQSLVENRISAYTETIKVGNNEMTRVRIGPFPTREEAEVEHERLKEIGLSGVITSR